MVYIYVMLLIVALRYLHIIKTVFEPFTPRVDILSIRYVDKTPVGDLLLSSTKRGIKGNRVNRYTGLTPKLIPLS